MLEIAFSWSVVSAVALLAIASGVGVLSMTPPETRIATILFSIGFPLLLVKLCTWMAFERSDPFTQKAFFIGLVSAASGVLWFACIVLSNSKVPQNGPQLLSFDAMAVGVGNMPERKLVTHTWDGKGWNEEHYSDVRLTIDNSSDYRIENLDLVISMPSTKDNANRSLIAAIDQLSHIAGIEFPKPQSQDMTVRLKGQDGNTYNLPLNMDASIPNGWVLPRPFMKLFAPRLLSAEKLKLIMGIVRASGSGKIVPKTLQISGTYDVVNSTNTRRTTINQAVEVKQ